MPDSEPGLRQIQYAFSAYIRDPGRNPVPPGVRPERMRMYRELFFNNVKSFIGGSFPVLKQVLGDDRWLDLVQDFFTRHRSATPYFSDFPEEFLKYLREERDGHPEDPPFLLELAHYEWVELALSIAEGEAPLDNAKLLEDPLDCSIVLSDVAWPLAYRFPVHRIGAGHQPIEPPEVPTFLAVYRDRDDDVRFLELNSATYWALRILEDHGPVTGENCIRRIASELCYPDHAALTAHGADLLRGLAERGLIGLA